MIAAASRKLDILLVEDSPSDRLLASEALSCQKYFGSLTALGDGEEALAYLRHQAPYEHSQRPNLILLDLHLPGKDGHQILGEIKADPELRSIGVVVLTTSKTERDVARAYLNHANGYIVKSLDFPSFVESMQSLDQYWGATVLVAPAPPQEAFRPPAPPPSALRLALLEDNPVDALLLQEALEISSNGPFALSAAESLEQFEALLNSASFDALVVDLGVGASQGLETFRWVRSRAQKMPIVVLTGREDEGLGAAAVREGAQDYLVKGQLSCNALARAIRYAIDRHSKEQQALLATVGQLAGGVAHEFNTLLAVVIGNTELMACEEMKSGEWEECLQEIGGAVGRASHLVHRMLLFSQRHPTRLRPLDLNGWLRESSTRLAEVLGPAIQLELQLAGDLPRVMGDPSLLEQCLLDLTLNARDAMPDGGVFTMTSRIQVLASGHFVRLTLQDNGVGMDRQVLERIFTPFFTTKDVGQGSGLGLASAQGIIQQHLGWIEVHSQPDRGTTFEIFLPAEVAR